MTDRKFHQGAAFRKLQREWYAKLEESGFYDIEGGVEGHMLKGTNPSLRLKSVATRAKKEMSTRGYAGPYVSFANSADSDSDLINFAEGSKARYYHHAMLIAVQAIREGVLSDERCYAWALHAGGEGERFIAEALEGPRSLIRKHINELRENIAIRLDNEYR